MQCITCKPIIENQFKDVNGIKKISVDYMTDTMAIEFDSSVLTAVEIKNRLDKSGYKFVRVAREY